MTRYAGPGRSRWKLAGKILGWLVVVVLIAAGALGGGIWLYLNESVAAIQPRSAAVKEIQEEEVLAEPLPGQPATAIIIGYDKRSGPEGVGDVGRSDTVMLLRADPNSETMSLLSFPRDLLVEHPGCKARGPWVGRINEAYTFCGPVGTVKTVKALTGLNINYALVVNFDGFKQIVDEVGGVYVDVDRRYFNDNSGTDQYATINLQPGYQRLTGGAALAYARYRHTDSDFHRVARQQAFVKAFKQRVESNFSLLKLPGVVEAITKNLEVVKGGRRTKIGVGEVLGYAKFIYSLPSGHFFQGQIDQVSGYAELTTSPETIADAVRVFLNPDIDASTKATAIAQGNTPKTDTPLPRETTITVLNGNGEEGSAVIGAERLAELGYQADSGGNADPENDGIPNYDYFQTEVVYDPAQAGAATAARVVGNLFGDAKVVEAEPGTEFDAMLKVIVGKTFHGELASAPVDETPEHAPAQTVTDASGVLPLLRTAKDKVDFPLFVPTVREASSSLDSFVGFRRYRVEGHDAIKLVYRTAGGEYWGVEETSWTDAPILSGENLARNIGGRRLQFYYDGSKLQRIAFEENGAVYWVSNTLLYRLSNETMIAIAKGLRPLAGTK